MDGFIPNNMRIGVNKAAPPTPVNPTIKPIANPIKIIPKLIRQHSIENILIKLNYEVVIRLVTELLYAKKRLTQIIPESTVSGNYNYFSSSLSLIFLHPTYKQEKISSPGL